VTDFRAGMVVGTLADGEMLDRMTEIPGVWRRRAPT
jgi:hypothetical protein